MEFIASQAPVRAGGGHKRTAAFFLTIVTLAVLAAGGWGVISSLGTEAPPAHLGEAVEVPGGVMLVEKVTPEHMAPMQNSKFAASGMSMSSMGMDMAPEGYRRLAVDVTLSATEGSDLSYSPEEFRLSAKGMNKETAPLRYQLEGGTLPSGSAISGSLLFQVPEKARDLRLSFEDGREVALNLKPDTENHSHGHHH